MSIEQIRILVAQARAELDHLTTSDGLSELGQAKVAFMGLSYPPNGAGRDAWLNFQGAVSKAVNSVENAILSCRRSDYAGLYSLTTCWALLGQVQKQVDARLRGEG